ncbi:MAG TPA: M14 family metallopeptidase [Gemmatimonadaceae bacterium]|nr:M14 family metallopeptidase [Gemmatimonadaceae bacterium]
MRSKQGLLCLLVLAACAQPSSPPKTAPARSRYPGNLGIARPLTHAERTKFAETSKYADVVQFLDSLRILGAQIHVGSIGKTSEGRDIPFVVASRPLVTTPDEARRLRRPIVYVQANIHAGEVEGKEAIQSLLRDLLFDNRANVLDSIVLIAVPIYNADGNERFAAQERNRSEQNGPELVGTRANAQGFDLNRDYVKAEAPETVASLAMFREWDPDVFVDLHTTDGSYHGYALTYAATLNPAARFTLPYTRDTMLVELRQRMRDHHGFEVFDYGNFPREQGAPTAWETYDSRPRFGTNYYGLRGRISVLSEAYSHDPFVRRVASTYDFVSELLSYVAANSEDVFDLSRESSTRTTGWGNDPRSAPAIPIRSTLATVKNGPIRVEEVQRLGDTVRYEAGLPRGVKRTGAVRTVDMPIYDRFSPSLSVPMPYAYAFPREIGDSLLKRLVMHGVTTEVLAEPTEASVATFTVDSTSTSTQAFQKHHERRMNGSWSAPATRTLPAGTVIVRTGQPLGVLAVYLLEPASDDGFVDWNVLDPWANDRTFPVVRIVQPVQARLRPTP